MTVLIQCPTCQSHVASPGAIPGQILSCPTCGNQFLVPATMPQASAPIAAPPVAPSLLPPMVSPPYVASRPLVAPPAPHEPPAPAATMAPVPVAPPASSPKHLATVAPTAAPLAAKAPRAVASSSGVAVAALPTPSTPPATPARSSQSARFIAADTAAARFDLTADGKLPELVLSDRDQAAAPEATTQRSQPWLLIGLLVFSVTSSVLMLLLDTSASTDSKTSRATAREAIRVHYAGQPPRLEPYQTKLRLALQAGQRGDRAEERRLYQEVLALLRSEGTSKFRGLTGMASSEIDPEAGGPPNDRHLERQISILLSDE